MELPMSHYKKSYKFRIEIEGDIERIYVRFHDGDSKQREVEISKDVLQELDLLNKSIRNIQRSAERHKEYRELVDEELIMRGVSHAPSAEEEALNNILIEEMMSAFLKLPTVQARRYLLAHVYGLSYAEIAEAEGCSLNAVKHSLVIARKNLQRILDI